jgi:hypothetical protein
MIKNIRLFEIGTNVFMVVDGEAIPAEITAIDIYIYIPQIKYYDKKYKAYRLSYVSPDILYHEEDLPLDIKRESLLKEIL